jgi:hypothetical protein
MKSSIYIYKEECLSVCLSVRYVFSPYNIQRHQTFHDASLGPGKGRDGVRAPEEWGWEISPLLFEKYQQIF